MKVILLQDIKKLGRRLDVKDVADGYAIHFLFKNKSAMPATPENTAKRAGRIAREETTREKICQEAARLEKEKCVLTLKTGPRGEVYNSITADDIKRALIEKGYNDVKEVRLPAPIRVCGEHTAMVDFGNNIIVNITLSTEGKKNNNCVVL